MNPIEKFIYNIVKHNPNLKNKIRNIYQDLFAFISKDKYSIQGKLISYDNYFFGFHDVSPFSPDNKKVLVHKILFQELRMPLPNDTVEIGYLHGENFSNYKPISISKAWNWHKGSRLQWLGCDNLIHNDYFQDTIVSKIINVNDGTHNYLSYPIDTISKNGKIASSFNYDRLEHLMPGYGYRQHLDETIPIENAPSDDGLYIIDLKSGSQDLLIDLNELRASWEGFNETKYYHFVTHTEFNNSSDKIFFLHRVVDRSNLLKRFSRLICIDLSSKELHIAPTDGMVSHFHVNSRDQVIAYCSINNESAHYFFSNYKMNEFKNVSFNSKINSDGHQYFFHENPQQFVTDTYPDKTRYSSLNVVDIMKKNVEQIINIKSPVKYRPKDIYTHWSCDLHPRVSSDDKYICFDSTHSMVRSINFLKL